MGGLFTNLRTETQWKRDASQIQTNPKLLYTHNLTIVVLKVYPLDHTRQQLNMISSLNQFPDITAVTSLFLFSRKDCEAHIM